MTEDGKDIDAETSFFSFFSFRKTSLNHVFFCDFQEIIEFLIQREAKGDSPANNQTEQKAGLVSLIFEFVDYGLAVIVDKE